MPQRTAFSDHQVDIIPVTKCGKSIDAVDEAIKWTLAVIRLVKYRNTTPVYEVLTGEVRIEPVELIFLLYRYR